MSTPPSQVYEVLRSEPWPLLYLLCYIPAFLPLLVVFHSSTLWAGSLRFSSTTVLEFVSVYFYYLEVSRGHCTGALPLGCRIMLFNFFTPMSSREIYCLSFWYYLVPISLGGLVCCFRCTYLEEWTTFPLLIWHSTFIMDCGCTHLLGLVSELSCPTPVVCVVQDSHLGHPYNWGSFDVPSFLEDKMMRYIF